MTSPETVIEADRLRSVGEAARAPEWPPDPSIRALDHEIATPDALQSGRLWLGIAVALPFALAFWGLVWLTLYWALHI